MKTTKLLALLLALTLVFTLAACGNGNNDDPSGSQQGTNAPLNREDDTSSTDNQCGTQSGNNNPSNVGDIDIGSIMSGNGSTAPYTVNWMKPANSRLFPILQRTAMKPPSEQTAV